MESRSSSMSSPPYNISSNSTAWLKSYMVFLYTHLRSLNVRHFVMAGAMRLEYTTSRSLEWQYLHTKFHENPLNGSKAISGNTVRQADDLTSPLLIFVS
jgi:hypothetical protein